MTIYDPRKPPETRQVQPVYPPQQEMRQVLPQHIEVPQPVVYAAPTPKGAWVPWIIGLAVFGIVVAVGLGKLGVSMDDGTVATAAVETSAPTTAPRPTDAPRPTNVPQPAAAPVAAPAPTAVPPEPTLDVKLKLNPAMETQKTDINPDGSYTINHGQVRYYVDTESNIVDVRLPGSEEYLKRVPTDPPATPFPAYVLPTAVQGGACASRHGCPKP